MDTVDRWNAPSTARPVAKVSNDPVDRPLAVGDVVTLRSGGHAMTVERFAPAPPSPPGTLPGARGFHTDANALNPVCVWHSGEGLFQERVCWPHTLARVGDDRPEEESFPSRSAGGGERPIL